jgi:hypothetical protein
MVCAIMNIKIFEFIKSDDELPYYILFPNEAFSLFCCTQVLRNFGVNENHKKLFLIYLLTSDLISLKS